MTQDLDKVFKYHSPKSDQIPRYRRLREEAKFFANLIIELCPESREKAQAITNLEQTVMWANAAIARNEE